MDGIKVGKNAFIDLSSTEFECLYCGEKHNDSDDKFCKRIEKNKCGYTMVTCQKCSRKFYVTADYMGDLQSFTLKKEIK